MIFILCQARAQHGSRDHEKQKLEAHHKMGLGETPRRFILKRCRYSYLEKFEDAFDTSLWLMQTKPSDVAFSGVFRLDAPGDVISGMALDYVVTDVPASFADYKVKQWSNYLSLCHARPVLRTLLVFINILQPTVSS